MRAEPRHKESKLVQISLIVMLTVGLVPAAAVARPGTLRGTVTDSTGAVLPGARVEVCGPASGGDCRSTTNPATSP